MFESVCVCANADPYYNFDVLAPSGESVIYFLFIHRFDGPN